MKQLITFLFILLFGFEASAQIKLSVEGKDFWFSMMPNFASTGGVNSPAADSVLLTISAKQNTTGIIENVATGFSQPFTVNALSVTEIPISNTFAASLNTSTIDSTSIHIYSEDTITAFVANMHNATRDATNLIPTQALGKEYMVMSYAGGLGLSQFLVVSTEDNMNIKITPASNTAGGQPAGVPFTITLDRGEVYLVQGDSTGFDMTGSLVTSIDSGTNCSNFAVFGGSSCTFLPVGCSACDQVFSILPPIAAWGNEYLLAPFQVDSLSTYRITALNNNTDVLIDGNYTVTLNAGEYFEVNHDSSARCINSDSLIGVTQFMEGKNCSTDGDPAMLVINSVSQGVNDAIFTTIDVLGTADTNFATIITNQAGIGVVEYDGNLLDSNDFIQFQECSDYYYSYISLPIGAHTIHSEEKFSLYIYGMTGFDSYAYSAGSTVFVKGSFKEETCSYSKTTFKGDSLLNNYWWYRLDDPEDTLGTSLNLTLTSPIAPGIYVFSGYSPVSGCKEDVFYKVKEPTTGIGVQILADPESVCPGEEVQLSFVQRRSVLDYNFEDSSFVNDFTIFENVEISSNCGSFEFNSLTFNGAPTRAIATDDVDASAGGFVEFLASVEQEACDSPDPEDVLYVDYSINAGANWVRLDSLSPNDFPSFKRFRALLPGAAETTATRFRVIQASGYIAGEDIWLIDELKVFVRASSIADSLRWTPSALLDDTTSLTPIGAPLDTTVFSVYFRDSAGCEYSDSIRITAPEPLPEAFDFDTTKCDNIPFTFSSISGGGTYEWKPSEGISNALAQTVTISNTESTQYTVKIVDPWGCDSTEQEVNVEVKTRPIVPNFDDTIVCDGGVIYFVISDTTATILWSDNSNDNQFRVENSGTYWYQASNECGTGGDTIYVTKGNNPELEIGPDLLLCPNEPLILELEDDGNAYFWSNGTAGVRNEFTIAGTYTVTVTTSEGCIAIDSLVVYDDCETLLNFPNVLTPNGDGVNDVFWITLENYQDVQVQIYNRWGQSVFYSSNPFFAWDGTVGGSPSADGVYFVLIQITAADGREINYKGSITLLRQ